jgi:hypothetical protein
MIDPMGLDMVGRRMTQKECDAHCKNYCDGRGVKVEKATIETTSTWIPSPTSITGILRIIDTCVCKCCGEQPSPFPSLDRESLDLPMTFKQMEPRGNMYNQRTGETVSPDPGHEHPILPHFDYRDPRGKWWRIFPQDGKMYPKR